MAPEKQFVKYVLILMSVGLRFDDGDDDNWSWRDVALPLLYGLDTQDAKERRHHIQEHSQSQSVKQN